MTGVLRRSDTLPFTAGFLLLFGAAAYTVLILGTRDIVCITMVGVYCNWFYPELFFLNALFGVPSDNILAGPLTLLSWSLLSLLGGLAGIGVGRGVRRLRASRAA